MKKISFVIPCYRSERTLPSVVREIVSTVETRPDYDYEIILVSDCSPDNVYSVIIQLARENRRIKGIELTRNFGQHSALMAGYRQCTGDIIVSLDDDGQTPANELFLLVDKLEDGHDVVYGSFSTKKQSFFRAMGTSINKFMLVNLLDMPRNLNPTSYYACKNYVLEEMIRYHNPFPYVGGLIFRTTKSITSVNVNQRERSDGSSGYTIKKLISLWVNGFTAFSVKPLRIATLAGCVCSLIGFFIAIYIIAHKIFAPATPAGYSSVMAGMLFIGGLIMVILGLIGEYIGRIYISINNSPQYVIRNAVNLDSNGEGAPVMKGKYSETKK